MKPRDHRTPWRQSHNRTLCLCESCCKADPKRREIKEATKQSIRRGLNVIDAKPEKEAA